MKSVKLSNGFKVQPPDSDNEISIEVCCDYDGLCSVYFTEKDLKKMLKMYKLKRKEIIND